MGFDVKVQRFFLTGFCFGNSGFVVQFRVLLAQFWFLFNNLWFFFELCDLSVCIFLMYSHAMALAGMPRDEMKR